MLATDSKSSIYWRLFQDIFLTLAFVILLGTASKRFFVQSCRLFGLSMEQSDEVVIALNFLIFVTALARATWFLIVTSEWKDGDPSFFVSYFEGNLVATSVAQILVTYGTITIFGIFILFSIFWSNEVKKVFRERQGADSNPKLQFLASMCFLFVLEHESITSHCRQTLNVLLYTRNVYSSKCMLFVDCCFFFCVSLLCNIEISLFSSKFRTVLKTFGEVTEELYQHVMEAQVHRILWITVSSNLFLFARATTDAIIGFALFFHWKGSGNFNYSFSQSVWSWLMFFRYTSELALLIVILYVSSITVGHEHLSENQLKDTWQESCSQFRTQYLANEWESFNVGDRRYLSVENSEN